MVSVDERVWGRGCGQGTWAVEVGGAKHEGPWTLCYRVCFYIEEHKLHSEKNTNSSA